jgi:hypothetical protein
VAKVLPGDSAPTQLFGEAVSQAQGGLLCGARGDDENGENAGAAYVFIGGPAPPQEQAKLTPPDARAGQLFSAGAVSLVRDLAGIGAVLDDDRGLGAGAAYVFREDRAQWKSEAKLLSPDGGADDRFGSSIDLLGGEALVGARFHGSSGAVYSFVPAGEGWRFDQKLTGVGATRGAQFGDVLAVADSLAVGAPHDDALNANAGAVFVFERGQDGRWAQVARLVADDGGVDDVLGISVAIDGETIIAGAPFHDGFDDNAGAGYVFRRSREGVWEQVAKLPPADPQFEDVLGFAVAIEGDIIAVNGQPFIDERGPRAGVVHLYREVEPGRWEHVVEIAPSFRNAGDQFGRSLALQNGILLVGAPFTDGPAGEDSGAVYVYDLTRGPSGAPDGRGGDINKDGVTDLEDYKLFAACLTGPETPVPNLCLSSRLDCDDDADLADFVILQQHLAGTE